MKCFIASEQVSEKVFSTFREVEIKLIDSQAESARNLETAKRNGRTITRFSNSLDERNKTVKTQAEEIERLKELCHDYYSAGLTAGHPMTSSNVAKKELDELNKLKGGE